MFFIVSLPRLLWLVDQLYVTTSYVIMWWACACLQYMLMLLKEVQLVLCCKWYLNVTRSDLVRLSLQLIQELDQGAHSDTKPMLWINSMCLYIQHYELVMWYRTSVVFILCNEVLLCPVLQFYFWSLVLCVCMFLYGYVINVYCCEDFLVHPHNFKDLFEYEDLVLGFCGRG